MAKRRQELDDGGLIALGVTAVVGTGVYLGVVKPWLDKKKAEEQLKKDQQSTISVKPGGKLFDVAGRPIKSANLSVIAADLYDSLKFPTDDPRVVRVFQTTPFGYVPQLERFYLDKYGKDLKTELVKNLNDKSWIAIKYNFR